MQVRGFIGWNTLGSSTAVGLAATPNSSGRAPVHCRQQFPGLTWSQDRQANQQEAVLVIQATTTPGPRALYTRAVSLKSQCWRCSGRIVGAPRRARFTRRPPALPGHLRRGGAVVRQAAALPDLCACRCAGAGTPSVHNTNDIKQEPWLCLHTPYVRWCMPPKSTCAICYCVSATYECTTVVLLFGVKFSRYGSRVFCTLHQTQVQFAVFGYERHFCRCCHRHQQDAYRGELGSGRESPIYVHSGVLHLWCEYVPAAPETE